MVAFEDEQTSYFKDEYEELFSSRMAEAGLTPTTRIGIAVSGGPDSTALCILVNRWILQNGGFSTNLMGFIVDHGLRKESASEALIVQSRIASLGIRCEVLKCFWEAGAPVHGHLQEAARNARYELIHQACKRNNVAVLLTAHHLDDQIELFIIRLTRHSGVAGLAAMPFMSTKYRCMPENAAIHALIVVRPLLGFRKNDLYKVCNKHAQLWVEDPTNTKPIFLRNVVRSILNQPEFCMLKEELPPLITLCGKLRSLFDKGRDYLLREVVSIDEVFGYVIMDLEKLKHVEADEQSLKRMLVAVLQFVAQKEKPPRGKVVQALIAYMKSNPLKGSLTIAGCNIFMEPGSKQSRIIICASCNSKLPASTQPTNFVCECDSEMCSESTFSGHDRTEASVPTACVIDGKLKNDSATRLMEAENPLQFLNEAKGISMLSNRSFIALSALLDKLSLKTTDNLEDVNVPKESEKRVVVIEGRRFINPEVPCEHACFFMNRFLVAWGVTTYWGERKTRTPPLAPGCERAPIARSCLHPGSPLWIRCMEEKDWYFLSQCAEKRDHGVHWPFQDYYDDPYFRVTSQRNSSRIGNEIAHARPCYCLAARAQFALAKLRRIPIPVRLGLPVFVTCHGNLVSIPSLGFSISPNIWLLSRFSPKVPLGGGPASWLMV